LPTWFSNDVISDRDIIIHRRAADFFYAMGLHNGLTGLI